MSALPVPMTEADVEAVIARDLQEMDHEQAAIREHQADGARLLEESRMPFVDVVRKLREVGRCTACGKTRVVLNVASRGFRAERVTAETHCACPGGPAATKNDDTLVEFEGQQVRWGSLTLQDRKACLAGGFPF